MTTAPPQPPNEDPDTEASAGRSEAGRTGRGQRRAPEPEGWRTGPAWREMRKGERGPWRDRIRALLMIAAVAVLALVAIHPSEARALLHGHGHSSSDSAAPPDETVTPSATPSTTATVDATPELPTTSDPFAGSPALKWGDGAAAIVLPRPTHVGGVTAQQVGDVLRTTKAYLVASNLDPAELRGGYPSAALRLLDPVNGEPASMKSAVRAPTAKADPQAWFTRYDPTRVQLVGKVIKVKGQMSFAKADHGSVRVHTDYTYVYAFTKAGGGDGQVSRVIVRRTVDTQWYPGEKPGEVQLVQADSYFGGSGCGFTGGHLEPSPWYPTSVTPAGAPTTDPYDRSADAFANLKGCGAASRT